MERTLHRIVPNEGEDCAEVTERDEPNNGIDNRILMDRRNQEGYWEAKKWRSWRSL